MAIPKSAEIVVIGGGAVGCGIAYALAVSGRTDVLVVERRSQLAQGTSSQGAGLCGQVRTTPERTRLAMYSAAAFARFQAANAPVKPDWNEVGSLRLATTAARAEELRQLERVCRTAGLEVELIDRGRAQKLWPELNLQDVEAALWCPTDGYMIPAKVAKTYEYYCREHGVQFALDSTVEGIELKNGRVAGVRTAEGIIGCQYAINAAGPYAYEVARMVDLELPIVPIRHQYFVTEPIQGLDGSFPVLRVPETGLYARVDQGGLLLGGWEEDCVSLSPQATNGANGESSREPDWAVLKTFAQRFESMLPEVARAPVARVAKGWPTFTPDGRFIVGPSSQVPGYVMAGGCNAHGISGSPGLGQALVESLFSDQPSAYVRSLSPDRFLDSNWTWETARDEAEALCRNYYELVLFDAAASETATSGIELRYDTSEEPALDGHLHTSRTGAKVNLPHSTN